jgi:hypothetical protein
VAQSNDAGYAVRWYLDQNRVTHGFLYHRGHFTSYDFPGSQKTALLGINARNQALGRYTNTGEPQPVTTTDFLSTGKTEK